MYRPKGGFFVVYDLDFCPPLLPLEAFCPFLSLSLSLVDGIMVFNHVYVFEWRRGVLELSGMCDVEAVVLFAGRRLTGWGDDGSG